MWDKIECIGWIAVWLFCAGSFIAVQFGWEPDAKLLASVIFATAITAVGARIQLIGK